MNPVFQPNEMVHTGMGPLERKHLRMETHVLADTETFRKEENRYFFMGKQVRNDVHVHMKKGLGIVGYGGKVNG